MPNIFLSHSSEDAEFAADVLAWLHEDGYDGFLDFDADVGIAPGVDWEEKLYDRLRWADIVVCLVSASFLRSTWCSAEVGIARAIGKSMLPVRIGEADRHPLLSRIQHVDSAPDMGDVRRRLRGALERVAASAGTRWNGDRNPYPGLRAFDAERAGVFFGRVPETIQLIETLRARARLVRPAEPLIVVGPSGCGKSSLVRAGVIPRLAADSNWDVLAPVCPGPRPLDDIVGALAASIRSRCPDRRVDDVHDRVLNGGIATILDDLRALRPNSIAGDARFLMVLDQMEGLITTATGSARTDFLRVIHAAVESGMLLLATLRPEFLGDLLQGELAEFLVRPRIVTVGPLAPSSLREVIEGPARAAGIDVSGSLVERLVTDTGSGDALPLLAFVLEQLCDGVGRGGSLSVTRYLDLGGVRGALDRRADAALDEACRVTGSDRMSVLRGLLSLVTVDGHGNLSRRAVRLADLDDRTRDELDPFVTERLVAVDAGPDGGATVTVVHDAFVSGWEPLTAEAGRVADALRLRAVVEGGADDWAASERDPSRLLRGTRLAEASRLLTGRHAVVDLSAPARLFLDESMVSHRRARDRERWERLFIRAAFGIGVSLVMVSIVIFLSARALLLDQVDGELVQRADSAAHGGLADPKLLVDVPPGLLGSADLQIALIYGNGVAAAADQSSLPPLGADEESVARGERSGSARFVQLGGTDYFVVARPAGPGRALVVAQSLVPTEQITRTLVITLSIPVLLGLVLVGFTVRTAFRRRRKEPGTPDRVW